MDRIAFEEFLMVYEKDIYSFCCYLDAERAADLYQETVLAAFEMRQRIDPSQNPKSLLLGIAVGKLKNMRRKDARRQMIVPEIPLDDSGADRLRDREPGPEDQLQATAVSEAVQKAVAGLDDKFRIPLILYYFDDSDLGSIAQICGVPMGTIKSRLHKGRALVKAALEKEGFAP